MSYEESPIKALREKIQVSQRELADALDVHHSYIANLENNLISIDDEEGGSKIMEVLRKIAELGDLDLDELIEQQTKAQMASLDRIKIHVRQLISEVGEKLGGSSSLEGDEVMFFIDHLRDKCQSECKSPVTVIRDIGKITQRQLAQAAEVSQPYVARLERGELSIYGPYTGLRLMNYIIDALGIIDYDADEYLEILDSLPKIQEEFIKLNAERAKDKVKAAFEKLKKNKN